MYQKSTGSLDDLSLGLYKYIDTCQNKDLAVTTQLSLILVR